ncbi:MAG: hypothetical protein WB495_28860 [Xanthobacteraceae bacterium]
MTPIVRTIDGKDHLFALNMPALVDPVFGIFPEQNDGSAFYRAKPKWIRKHDGRATRITPDVFVSAMAGTPAATASDVPRNVIKKILAAALHYGAGGGAPRAAVGERPQLDSYPATYPIAERMLKDQNSREIEFFAGEIVAAALAAG